MSDDEKKDKCAKCGKCGDEVEVKSDIPDEVYKKWNKDLWDSLGEFEHLLANAMTDRTLSESGCMEILNTGYFHLQCIAGRIEAIMGARYGKEEALKIIGSIANEARDLVAEQMTEAVKKIAGGMAPAVPSAPDPTKLN